METDNKIRKTFPITAMVASKFILLKLPKSQADISFIRSLRYARWDQTAFCWVITYKIENVNKMDQYFGSRLQWEEPPKYENRNNTTNVKPESGTLIMIKYHFFRVKCLFVHYMQM